MKRVDLRQYVYISDKVDSDLGSDGLFQTEVDLMYDKFFNGIRKLGLVKEEVSIEEDYAAVTLTLNVISDADIKLIKEHLDPRILKLLTSDALND